MSGTRAGCCWNPACSVGGRTLARAHDLRNLRSNFLMAILYLVSVAAWRCPAPDPEVLAVLLGHAVPLLGCGGLCPVGREGAICILAVRDGAAVGQLLIDARKINIFDNDTISRSLSNHYLNSCERPNDHRQATRGAG